MKSDKKQDGHVEASISPEEQKEIDGLMAVVDEKTEASLMPMLQEAISHITVVKHHKAGTGKDGGFKTAERDAQVILNAVIQLRERGEISTCNFQTLVSLFRVTVDVAEQIMARIFQLPFSVQDKSPESSMARDIAGVLLARQYREEQRERNERLGIPPDQVTAIDSFVRMMESEFGPIPHGDAERTPNSGDQEPNNEVVN